MITADFDNVVVDGKPMSEWYIEEDEGVLDEEQLVTFKSALKNPEESRICVIDVGKFVIDDSAYCFDYVNGVDLIRLTGSLYRFEPYHAQGSTTCIDGEDVFNIARGSILNYNIEDLIFKYTHLLHGTVFVGKKTKHVLIKGVWGTESELHAYFDDYNSRIILFKK